MPLSLPAPYATANERALAQWRQEEFTGLVTAVVTLSQTPDLASGLLLVWKNGTLLRPSLNVLAGSILTLPSALIAGDWVVVFYKARGT